MSDSARATALPTPLPDLLAQRRQEGQDQANRDKSVERQC